jgi:PAS domain S-box-containing protein
MSRSLALAMILVVAVFVVDLITPLGVAVGTIYAVVMLFGLKLPVAAHNIALGVAASVLTVVGAWLSPAGGVGWMIGVNRGLSLLLIWSASLLVLRHRQAVDSLDRAQRTSETVLATAGVVIVALDTVGRVTLINRKGCELLGVPERDILGTDWFRNWLPEDERPSVEEVFGLLLGTRGQTSAREHVNRVRTADGTERLIAWQNSLLLDEQGEVVGTLGAGEDITGRLATERALGASRRELLEFKYALDQSSIVAITDASGRISYVNDMFCRISQYSRDELIGQDHRMVNSGFHSKEFIRGLWHTIQAGQVWKGEIRNRAKDGSFYWVDTTIVPFVGEDGRPYQYLAIRSDITKRKLADQALLEQGALVRLGEMAAVVAHEVKNPLAGIAGALQVIRSRLPPESADPVILDEILERIAALNATVQDLLIFARPRELVVDRVRLLPMLVGTAELLERDPVARGVSVEFPADDVVLTADGEQLRQVMLNVLLNAAQATGGLGTIRITTEVADGRCRISVADNGAGVPPEVIERVFEPFVTTKHRGTGLGLAIARRVVEAHGGEISVECPPSGGTVVTFELPGERVAEAPGGATADGESPNRS